MIEIKCCYSQRNSPGTERKDIPGNLCIMKANSLTKKLSFPLQEDLPIQSMISSCSENSQHPWRSHFSIEFS